MSHDAATPSRRASLGPVAEAGRSWWAYLALVAPVIALYSAGVLTHWWVFNAIGVSSAGAVVYGVHRHRPRGRFAWYLIALGLMLFVVGDFLAENYDALFGAPLPFPSIADPVYLAVYPCLAFGLLGLTQARHPLRDRGALIDAHILAVGVGTLAWEYLMDPYAQDRTLGQLAKLTSIAYPLSDVLLLAILAWLMLRSTWRGPAVCLIAASLTALFVTDAAYGWVQLHDVYRPGGVLDGGWLAFYALMGAAALHPSMGRMSEPVSDRPPYLSRGRLALLTAAVLVAPGAELVYRFLDQPVDDVLDISGALLFGLVLARLGGFVRVHGKATESALRERFEARLAALVRNASDVVSIVDDDGTVTFMSPSCSRLFGRSAESLTGRPLAALVHPDDAAGVEAFLAGLEPGDSGSSEFRVARADDTWRYVEAQATNLLEDETVDGIVLNSRDVTEREALERELARQAFYDVLTGLPNRELFRDRVDQALVRYRREGSRFAVVLLDLDDFKTVNDSLGHAIGDGVLREVAYRLHACARRTDSIARLGGDEFALLLEEMDDEREAIGVAERVDESLRRSILLDGLELHTTLSIGIVLHPEDADGAEVLLRNAEVAMYAAKASGSSCAVFEPAMHLEAVERLRLKADLKRAVERGEFSVVFNPIVDLEFGEIVGVDAVPRWNRPERGPVDPDEFMGLAEQMGLMDRLGGDLLRKACAATAQLLPLTSCVPPFTLSVFVSARQLRSPGFLEEVRSALAAAGLPPQSLALALPGRAMMEDVPLFQGRLDELRELGVSLAVAVFGNGDMSLNNVRRFPIDVLRLDPSFIEGAAESPAETQALMVSVLGLARVRGLTAIAGGIDEAAELASLRELGCALGQGRFLHAAMGAEGIATLLCESGPRQPVPGVANLLRGVT